MLSNRSVPDKRGRLRLWRLTRSEYVALDGAGAAKSVWAVFIAPASHWSTSQVSRGQRSWWHALCPSHPAFSDDDFVLGWTTINCDVERGSQQIEQRGEGCFCRRLGKEEAVARSCGSVRRLTRSDIILMNPCTLTRRTLRATIHPTFPGSQNVCIDRPCSNDTSQADTEFPKTRSFVGKTASKMNLRAPPTSP